MKHRPYSARLAAGLIVTALEETRRLPTQLVTMPMTAVSSAVQAGMRLQQNIAELAIKGDAVLDGLFDKPEEQPAWAVFDEDEESAPATPPPPAPAKPAPAPAATTTPAKKAPAKKAAAKKVAAKKAPAKKTAAKKAAPAADAGSPVAEASTGRFALYSSVPEVTDPPARAAEPKKSKIPAPEVAEFLDYDNLTLAQLRAKIRSVDVDDLRILADYERDSRNRTPFLTMLENRIAAKSDR
ncbi:lipid droplet-associated protein [Gordonia sp. X0973]|uniref:lipid droplet-associated protein n=1 Tax=Gordonia sp. X0973 TaxID=2742602 RepID=UPI000F535538|nr:lipid droplet-associated protein [Gordonia sp. X0973]QKT06650.1 lipid droplet-associated protein [Gordonia sp. X0973]